MEIKNSGKIHFRSTPELVHKLKVYCIVKNITIQDFLNKLIKEAIEK
jgi:uncharacterized membrane protein